jgi:hypothetical protein
MKNEVTRLRRLRQSALRARALARVLSAGGGADGVLDRGALLNWRIARIVTGRLRSHPYQSYQRDPSFFESGADQLGAILVGTMASLRGHALEIFLRELLIAARELDDTRALTLSAELSDALGRAQASMRHLIDDVQKQVSLESGRESDAQLDAPDGIQAPLSTSSYLAL